MCSHRKVYMYVMCVKGLHVCHVIKHTVFHHLYKNSFDNRYLKSQIWACHNEFVISYTN